MHPVEIDDLYLELQQLSAKIIIAKYALHCSPPQFRTDLMQLFRIKKIKELEYEFDQKLNEYTEQNETIKILLANEIEFGIIEGKIHI